MRDGGPRAAPGARPRFDAAVRGRVVDAAGAPLKEVSISWADGRPQSGGPDAPREVHLVASTDARGRYEVNLLPPGPCRMVAEWPHLWERRAVDLQSYPCTPVLRLRNGKTVRAPDIRLPADPREFGSVDVTVVGPDGRPVVGVSVYCSTQVSPWDRCGHETDSRGRIAFRHVRPGEVQLSCSSTARLGPARRNLWLPVGARLRTRIRLPLANRTAANRRTLRVECRDDRGRPLKGCKVYTFRFLGAAGGIRERKTDRHGVAVLTGFLRPEIGDTIHGSAWSLGHEHAQFEVPLGSAKRPVRARVVLRREVPVYFQVVDAGTRAPLRRVGLEVPAEGARFSSSSGPLGVLGPDPPEVPLLLRLTDHRFPVGTGSIRLASPGYQPRVLRLRIRPGPKPRKVVVPLEPA